jgi:hypothetical protein
MARPCSVCHHAQLQEISAGMIAGLSDVAIAKRYGLSQSATQRHRQHIGAPNSTVISERKSTAFLALASLPSLEEVGAAYSSIGTRIDTIAAKAETEGSLAVALMGLKELRSTVALSGVVAEVLAALKPRASSKIPRSGAAHLVDDSSGDAMRAQMEAILDAGE